ncbi:O-phosphoserine--tRNA ligase [archaeon]|nr:O-phosphoserine--tRNA ligase [archaeon]
MPKLPIKWILERLERGEAYDKVWRETSSLAVGRGLGGRIFQGKGAQNPVFEVAEKLRHILLDLGFREYVLPLIVDETEVYKQYGPQAMLILDRCYYLGTLPRPEIGLRKEKVEELSALGAPTDERSLEVLRNLLRSFKRGEVMAEELPERLATAWGVSPELAARAIEAIFPRYRKVQPQPTSLILRSHLTSSWFGFLAEAQYVLPHPIKAFSVDLRARREQREDTSHLRVHRAASFVILDEEVSLDDGIRITEEVLKRIGVESVEFVKKEPTSKYYAEGTEYEVIARSENQQLEVANLGMYSPVALARYGIEYPVFNCGIGIERIAMILQNVTDIRKLVYPFRIEVPLLSDEDIARELEYVRTPETTWGKELAKTILEAARQHANDPSPCTIVVFDGEVEGVRLRVELFEEEEGKRLLGPAAFNQIYVYHRSVLAIPDKGMEHIPIVVEARQKGVRTGYVFMEGIALWAAALAEDAVKGRRCAELRIRIVKSLSDVNMRISDVARRAIASCGGRIDVRGPAFVNIRILVE